MEYRYYNGKKDSNFNTLPGNYQRAIETEVNIELEARKLSKSYSKQFENPINQEKFFNNTCRITISCFEIIYYELHQV